MEHSLSEESTMPRSGPNSITFRHLPPSDELTRLVDCEAQRLRRHRPPVGAIHVVIELPPRSHRKGAYFRVRIEVEVPGRPLVARARHPDARTAIALAFRAASSGLSAYVGRRRATRPRVWASWPSVAKTFGTAS